MTFPFARYQAPNQQIACHIIRPLAIALLCLLSALTACAPQAQVPPPDFSAPVVQPRTGPLPGSQSASRDVVQLPGGRVAPANALPPRVAPQKVTGRVVIDPGHGGKDPGAMITSVQEKVINLAVGVAVAQQLKQQGVDVVMTRRTDVFIELADRAGMANEYGADLFVSIHSDFNPNPEKIGHSILLAQSGNPKAAVAAQLIDARMRAAGSPTCAVRRDDRGLVVLNRTTGPAILVELGFLSNRTEALRLRSADYQAALASGVAQGIVDYLSRN